MAFQWAMTLRLQAHRGFKRDMMDYSHAARATYSML